MLIERHVRASSQMNKTRANMRHFLTCIKFFHQFEKKSSNSNLPLSIFRMSIIADFCRTMIKKNMNTHTKQRWTVAYLNQIWI